MSGCPYCDGWRYDPAAPPFVAKPIGNELPVIYDGARLRVAYWSDSPDGRPMALGRHICEAHPMEPEVLLLGPVRTRVLF